MNDGSSWPHDVDACHRLIEQLSAQLAQHRCRTRATLVPSRAASRLEHARRSSQEQSHTLDRSGRCASATGSRERRAEADGPQADGPAVRSAERTVRRGSRSAVAGLWRRPGRGGRGAGRSGLGSRADDRGSRVASASAKPPQARAAAARSSPNTCRATSRSSTCPRTRRRARGSSVTTRWKRWSSSGPGCVSA